MDEKKKTADEGRRSFLKFMSVGAPAAAAATVAGTEAGAATEEASETGNGLRKTAHVKAYLASARF